MQETRLSLTQLHHFSVIGKFELMAVQPVCSTSLGFLHVDFVANKRVL